VWFRGVVAAIALLWPCRISGPFHGLPLDSLPDVIAIGVAFPLLWCFHPRFLATRFARGLIVSLLVWKAFSTAVLVQDGWCVRVVPSRPYVKDATGAPHSWDVRADWRSPDPACSAIMTRPYRDLSEFPVWYFNLAPPNDNRPDQEDRPPGARVAMTIGGFLYTARSQVLDVDHSDAVMAEISVDGAAGASQARVERGIHEVAIDSSMTGQRWRLAPRLGGRDLWAQATPTVTRPSRLDLLVRPWGRWLTLALVGALMLVWAASAFRAVNNAAILLWSAGASLIVGALAAWDVDPWSRWAIAALGLSVVVPVPRRLRNAAGALICIGIPWMVFVLVRCAPLAGRFTLYSWGDDFWLFQRFAYRIVMQGYWLEGGSPTFWFQPLYRWIAGVLHLVFGDSSIGESIWDGACLLAGALAAFRLTLPFAGYRSALIASAMSLAVFELTAARTWLGVGLGEISSAGFIYLAVYLVADRRRSMMAALLAGIAVTLGFYTRLNNLIMAAGVAAFALPFSLPVSQLWAPSRWLRRVNWRLGVCIGMAIGVGALLFAWRTWHYTGVFSMFFGTQRDMLATSQPGMTWLHAMTRMAGSVMMVLTVNDPPRFDPYALPVLIGAAVAALSVLGIPRFRTLPLASVGFFFASIVGALVARGAAYAGRFSVHVIPIACVMTVCAAAALTRRPGASPPIS
jgi:hypothetical protein